MFGKDKGKRPPGLTSPKSTEAIALPASWLQGVNNNNDNNKKPENKKKKGEKGGKQNPYKSSTMLLPVFISSYVCMYVILIFSSTTYPGIHATKVAAAYSVQGVNTAPGVVSTRDN